MVQPFPRETIICHHGAAERRAQPVASNVSRATRRAGTPSIRPAPAQAPRPGAGGQPPPSRQPQHREEAGRRVRLAKRATPHTFRRARPEPGRPVGQHHWTSRQRCGSRREASGAAERTHSQARASGESLDEADVTVKGIGFIITLGILLGSLAAQAQQTGNVYRIGFLGNSTAGLISSGLSARGCALLFAGSSGTA